MLYWDSSAILPLLLAEPDSEALRDVLRRDPAIVTWWGSRVECASAIARLEREETLDAADVRTTMDRLHAACAQWTEVPAIDDVRVHATRLLRTHRLRAADALQLAAALVASDFSPASLGFLSLDVRLQQAADREGFPSPLNRPPPPPSPPPAPRPSAPRGRRPRTR